MITFLYAYESWTITHTPAVILWTQWELKHNTSCARIRPHMNVACCAIY